MEGQVMGKEAVKYMEYLLKLLHKEWERSGRTKSQAVITIEEAGKVNRKIAGLIISKQKILENDDLAFKQSINISKENFILLRLVKKIKKAEEKAAEKGIGLEFSIELDKEEFKLYQSIINQSGDT